MTSLQTQDIQQSQTSLLDSALDSMDGLDPSAYQIAQIEENLRKSGSTWLAMTSNGQRIRGAWYAQDLEGNQYLTSEYYAKGETFLANWIRKHNGPEHSISIQRKGLTAMQSSAASLCLSHSLSCLSGLPGTGKTYTCESIASSLELAGLSVVGCALTGIAASRLKESAGVESTTIHRLLGWRGAKEGYTVKEVPYDVVMVDEGSMLDNQLLLSLVSRIRKDARLILVGDPNQLSSIEPSDTFRELCKVLPHAHLTEVLRQESDSPIGRAALSILAGNVPQNEDSEKGSGGCYVIPCDGLSISVEDNKQKRNKNHPLTVAERMSIADDTELRFVRTMASTNESVKLLNSLFTTYKSVQSKHPVMCIKNRNDLQIYNGDIGTKEWRRQRFGNQFTSLPPSHVVDAWATTVDKVQGQECLSGQLWIESFLGIRRAYTALTRAKRRFCFTGDISLLESCLHTPEEPRITLLSGLINGTVRYTDTSC